MPTFFIKTYGCQMNVHDSEKICGIFHDSGYQKVEEMKNADVIVLNTCSVREKPEQKIYTQLGRIKKIKAQNPHLIVAICGCVAQQEKEELFKKSLVPDLIIGPKNIHQLPELIEINHATAKKITAISGAKQVPVFELPYIERLSPFKAFITIMEGCNKFCSFCVVPFTRGREVCRPFNKILHEASRLVHNGYKEICLLGQNVNSYVYDKYTFPDLLDAVGEIPSLQRIRFVTSYPKDLDDKLIDVMKNNNKICNSLHLPVQSGSNDVLNRMRRGYTREDYLNTINSLKKAIPSINLSTDIIVGFPGETDQDFQLTLDLVQQAQFTMMYSFKYSPRPYTCALRYADNVPEQIKEKRLAALQELQKAIQIDFYKELVGQDKEILVDGCSKRNIGEQTGRTTENIIVNFAAGKNVSGKIVLVRITHALNNCVKGEIIKILD